MLKGYIKIFTDNTIIVSRWTGVFPKEITYKGAVYIYGTLNGADTIYFKKDWIYG